MSILGIVLATLSIVKPLSCTLSLSFNSLVTLTMATSTTSCQWPEETESIEKEFMSQDDMITGHTIYVPRYPCKLDASNYSVHLQQTLPEVERQLVIFPLCRAFYFNPLLEQISHGLAEEMIFDRKFEGIGKNIVLEHGGYQFYIENNGDGVTLLSQMNRDVIIGKIEVKNINKFMNLHLHAGKYFEKLWAERSVAIKKEVEDNTFK